MAVKVARAAAMRTASAIRASLAAALLAGACALGAGCGPAGPAAPAAIDGAPRETASGHAATVDAEGTPAAEPAVAANSAPAPVNAVAAPTTPDPEPAPPAETPPSPPAGTPAPPVTAPAPAPAPAPARAPVPAPRTQDEDVPPAQAPGPRAGPASRGGPATGPAPLQRKDEPPYGVQRALCIGINDYEAGPSAGAPLNFAENDARELARLLREGFEFETKTLIGPEATKRNIDENLERLLRESGERDVLLVFFAGHGQKVARTTATDGAGAEANMPMDGYLLPQDVPLTLANRDTEAVYRSGAINMRDLAARLASDAVAARHVLLILDCCCSGYALESRGGESRPGADYIEALVNCRTRQVITAGKKDDKSYEYGEDDHQDPRHGMFTSVLLELLADEVKRASPQPVLALMPELQQRVFDRVKARLGGRIVPQRRLLVDTGGDYVFIPGNATEWKEPVRREAAADGVGGGGFGGVSSRDATPVSEAEVAEVADDARGAAAQGTDLSQDSAKSARVDRLEMRAAAGDRRAMEALVYCYRNGVGVPRNEEHAAYWAMQANDLGDARGTFLLAELIQAGSAGVRTQDAAATAALFRGRVPPNVAAGLRGAVPWIPADGASDTTDAAAVTRVASGFWDWIRRRNPASDPLSTLAAVDARLATQPTRWDDIRDDMSEWKQAIDASKDRASESEADRAIRRLVGDLLFHASRQQRPEATADVAALREWFRRLGAGAAGK